MYAKAGLKLNLAACLHKMWIEEQVKVALIQVSSPSPSSKWLTLVTVVHEQRFITLHLYGCVEDVMPRPYDPLCILQHYIRVCAIICRRKNLFRSEVKGL